MAIGRGVRTAWRRIEAAGRVAGRLRPGGGAHPSPAPPPAPEPGAGVARPVRDEALLTRLGRWRGRAGAPSGGTGGPATGVTAAMTARERADAMRDLRGLRGRLARDEAGRIDAALAEGAVSVRRLSPADGHLWEMPGLRVFAIVGVQAFTVEDPLAGGADAEGGDA